MKLLFGLFAVIFGIAFIWLVYLFAMDSSFTELMMPYLIMLGSAAGANIVNVIVRT